MASAQQVELAEVQVSAAFLAELATADPGSGSGHHGPGDPGPAAGLQYHEAVGPGRLQHLAELRLGERDLVEQRVQGHAAPVGAQDFGDEAAHFRVRHGSALARPRGAGLCSGENRNLREPRGWGRARAVLELGARRARECALPAVSGARRFRFLWVRRTEVTYPIPASDVKSTATATEWKESEQRTGGSTGDRGGHPYGSRWVLAPERVRFPSWAG